MLWLIIRSEKRWQPGVLLFAVASFVLGMEEISWGQRLFDISTPQTLKELNYKGELTIHNLALSGQYYPYLAPLIIAYSVAFPLLAKLSSRFKNFCVQLSVPLVAPRCVAFFLLPAYFLDFLDTRLIPIPRGHELVEVTLGIAMAIHAVDYVTVQLADSRARSGEKISTAAGVLIIIGLLTAPLTIFGEQRTFKKNINDFAFNAYPQHRMYDQAIRVFDYLREHPELAADATPLYEAFVYFEKGDVVTGATRLTPVLDEMTEKLQRQPDTETYRRAALALMLLDRPAKATDMLFQAIDLDRGSISATDDVYANARRRASLGLTFMVMGDIAAAEYQFQLARESASTPRDRGRLAAEIRREKRRLVRVERIKNRAHARH